MIRSPFPQDFCLAVIVNAVKDIFEPEFVRSAPVIVSYHLKLVPGPDPGMLVGNMLSNGSDEFLGCEDLEISLFSSYAIN